MYLPFLNVGFFLYTQVHTIIDIGSLVKVLRRACVEHRKNVGIYIRKHHKFAIFSKRMDIQPLARSKICSAFTFITNYDNYRYYNWKY